MKVEIVERNYNVSEHLRNVLIKKVEKLDKYFDDEATDCKVYFKKENNSLKTELMLDYHGNFIRAQVVSDNFYDNIDKLLPKVEGQIRKYRTKFDKARKNVAFKDEVLYEAITDEVEYLGKIVKEKDFKLNPMTIEEAIEQMDLLGHSFFLFLDKSGNKIKLLYLRSDGTLGLINPEI